MSDGSYTGTLTISPLAQGDGGALFCTGTVTGGTEIQSASSTDITVAGSRYIVSIIFLETSFSPPDLPSLVVTISSSSIDTMAVGDTLEFACSVTVEEHLIPSAELSIEWSGGRVGGSGVVENETRAIN